jgi:hypothetical protein
LQTDHAINAIYPHRHHLSAKVRSFIDLLAKHFRADPAWADPSTSSLAVGSRTDGAFVTNDAIIPADGASVLVR